MDRLSKKSLRLKEEKKAYILAHFYQRPEVQAIADAVGDSFALAQKAFALTPLLDVSLECAAADLA